MSRNLIFLFRLVIGLVWTLAIYGSLLFLPAGTLDWWRAWVFMGVIFVGTIVTMVTVFRNNEGLLLERFKPPVQKGQPLPDKVLVILLLAAYFGQILLIPLDVFRFHLLPKPGAVISSLGMVLVITGWCIISLAFRENAFASPVVRLQDERQQRVIATGVYSIVRHPMYSGAIIFFVGLPLWLESYAAALASIVLFLILTLRILIEEQFLRRELKGYDDYTKRVRYRLIPFLW